MCFQVAIHRNLVLLCSFAYIFATNRSRCGFFPPTSLSRDCLSFKPRVPHSSPGKFCQWKFSFWVFLTDLNCWLSSFNVTTQFLPLFISIQSSVVAAAGNMKRITCCAVEDFSCNRPAWHWVFTTTNIKSFMNWLQFETAQSVMKAEKHLFIQKCRIIRDS